MPADDFKVIGSLGKGAYSTVQKVQRKSDGQVYALKKVLLQGLSKKEKENALNEVRILASVQHPNIISYKECFLEDSPSALCIIMEYADGGDLYQKIVEQKKKKKLFSEAEIWETFIQIVKGLNALHKNKILHRDLKCANIFLNKDGTVKLGDLNVSKVAKMGLVYTQTGTPYYASPEVWQDKPYDNRSDIWSLGCVIYEMITLRPPFTASSMQELCNKVKKGVFPKIPSTFSRDLSTVVATLLKVSPLMRPSCEQILHMPCVEEHLTDEETKEICKDLLNTIKIPRNMKFLQQKLPASQYENEKVEEDAEEENYDEDFERPEVAPEKDEMKENQREQKNVPLQKKGSDKKDRMTKRPKGLPPTAPQQRVIPPMPQSNRNQSSNKISPSPSPSKEPSRNIQSRRGARGQRISEGVKKKRKNPKTTEAALAEPKSNRFPLYRMHSRERQNNPIEPKRKVSEIYRMRAKEIADKESRAQKELRHKYQDRIYNPNNKYLSRDYASINKSARKNLAENRRIMIDPTNNAQKLEQILGNKVPDSRHSVKRRYQPLSENYRGVENKLSVQVANPVPPAGAGYNRNSRGGSRGHQVSSITPNSSRKEGILVSRLKENYKNSGISKGGYYVPPSGLKKMANVNSQRSQPILGGLRNNLARRYVSNQVSMDNGRNAMPAAGILNQKRVDLSSARLKQRINNRHQYNVKPMSAKAPSWWG